MNMLLFILRINNNMVKIYRGFNTVDNNFGSARTEDEELIKRDLLNHFMIRKGEKLMNPEFGSEIWTFIFDPFTEDTKQSIIDDVTAVVNNDPRTQVQKLDVTEFMFGIQIAIELLFVQTNQSSNLLLKFNKDTNQLEVL